MFHNSQILLDHPGHNKAVLVVVLTVPAVGGQTCRVGLDLQSRLANWAPGTEFTSRAARWSLRLDGEHRGWHASLLGHDVWFLEGAEHHDVNGFHQWRPGQEQEKERSHVP